VFNTTPHSSTGYTPHELLFGRKANIPGILQKETPEIRYNYESYVQDLQSCLQSCYEVARSNLKINKEKSKEYYDRNTCSVVRNRRKIVVTCCYKFWANYTGCLNNIRQTDRPIKEVNELKLLLRQLTRNEDDSVYTLQKRGVFNFIGGISKILFGTMDNEDANYYTGKISHLENVQLDF